ncbi:Alkaline phosphatase [Rhodovastum atsumiense]|uniref:Alkaline phosphatase n=1 Tax=Rhodovastum atsumiense TaxID=504468 RepID=A0A5M6IY74_9PROT|nr:alkaline phosphatase [Rhodovastum atsumiense]KAA5613293.1 alkaline phosphatase [Rhodovastum atsumiense]CAH2600540.1 Alkaline phosphatase [Rhodovastum atsumiense]
MLKSRLASAALLACAVAPAVHAQTIYPLNRAEILSGAKFDFKVEFPGAPAQNEVKVTINGRDPAAVFGKPASFVQREDGQDYSAYVIRDVKLTGATHYKVEASAGGSSASVGWDVFDTKRPRAAKNVILFIGDGLSVAHRTAARMLSKGIAEGRYGGELAIDDMPHMALVSTSGTDSIVTDSANAMSAYTTGHKSCVNALGVYCARNKNTLEHPKVETLGEIARRKGLAVGVVTNTEIEDATPAGMVAHTRRRADYNDIVRMFWEVKPEVIMGGGSPNWLAKSTPGSKRTDETDYIGLFEKAGWKFASTQTEMKDAAQGGATKLLGLFNTGNIDGALDRFFLKKGTVARFQDQPDLTDQVRAALDILQKNQKGFVLMVESGRIDKYSHSLDAERAIYDTIMLDNAVKLAKDWAAAHGNDTMIVVVGDHGHPVSVIGTYDDARGETPREKLGTYAEAGYPNYPPANAQGYPEKVDVSRRLGFVFGSYPDFCFNARPYLDGENVPAVAGSKPGTYVANEKYCTAPGAVRITGNLPVDANSGVHAADDVVLTATGPGSEQFRGRIDNTRVFRTIATALTLGE